jgi:hypothetical protein
MSENPNKNASAKPEKITDDKLDAVVPKLIRPLRMLSSAADGEVLAAVRVILQVLIAAGLDIHVLVSRVEHGKDDDGKLTAAEVQAIYDKGFADGHSKGAEQGRRSAVIAAARPMSIMDTSDVGSGVNGHHWFEIVQHCATNRDRIHRDKDREFIDSIYEQIALHGRSPSPPQAKWLRDIFNQRFGGRID